MDDALKKVLDDAVAAAPSAVGLLDAIASWASGHPARRVEDVRGAHSHTAAAIDELRGTGSDNPSAPEPPDHASHRAGPQLPTLEDLDRIRAVREWLR